MVCTDNSGAHKVGIDFICGHLLSWKLSHLKIFHSPPPVSALLKLEIGGSRKLERFAVSRGSQF